MRLDHGMALVVLSGGQDSVTCLHLAIKKHGAKNVYAVTFDYGQRHVIEIDAARIAARMAGIGGRHEIINVRDLLVSTSPLTSTAELEKYTNAEQMEQVIGDRIEKTFVPMRNTLFLTIAANRAVAHGCRHIYTGICQADNANYPDCRESFRVALEDSFGKSLGIEWYDNGIRIQAPLMNCSKAATCLIAARLGFEAWEALAYSHTSYDGAYPPTDMNHSNILRADGFEKAELPDPLVVRAWCSDLMPLPASSNYDKLRDCVPLPKYLERYLRDSLAHLPQAPQ